MIGEFAGSGLVVASARATLTDRERILDPDHPDTLTTRNNLAGAYWDYGRRPEGLREFTEAATTAERLFGPGHFTTDKLVENRDAACSLLYLAVHREQSWQPCVLVSDQNGGLQCIALSPDQRRDWGPPLPASLPALIRSGICHWESLALAPMERRFVLVCFLGRRATPSATPTAEIASSNNVCSSRYDLALTEARRGFDEQATQMTRVRTTMTGLLASGGVTFSVLVIATGQSNGANQHELLIAAAVAFGILAICVVVGGWPRKVTPGVRPHDLIAWADEGDPPDTAARSLAHYYEEAYKTNKKQLDRLTHLHMVCLSMFALTIVILTARLIGV